MPQNDRYRTRVVPLEFNAHEDFSGMPADERMHIILLSKGLQDFA